MNELTQGLCPAPSGTKNPVQRLTSSLGSGNCLGSTHPPVQQTQSSASLYTNFLLRLEPPLCPVRRILSFHITYCCFLLFGTSWDSLQEASRLLTSTQSLHLRTKRIMRLPAEMGKLSGLTSAYNVCGSAPCQAILVFYSSR